VALRGSKSLTRNVSNGSNSGVLLSIAASNPKCLACNTYIQVIDGPVSALEMPFNLVSLYHLLDHDDIAFLSYLVRSFLSGMNRKLGLHDILWKNLGRNERRWPREITASSRGMLQKQSLRSEEIPVVSKQQRCLVYGIHMDFPES